MSQPTSQSSPASAPPCVAANGTVDASQWFATEVHPHDGQLKSYLKGNFPAVRDVEDVVQESYLRIWKARASQPIKSTKAFLFTIARHLALDVLRRGYGTRIISVGDVAALPVVDDRPSVSDLLSEREFINLLGDAVVALPERTRTIIILHKFQGLTQAEVARRLGLTEKAVERQVARGVELCERYFRRRGHEFF